MAASTSRDHQLQYNDHDASTHEYTAVVGRPNRRFEGDEDSDQQEPEPQQTLALNSSYEYKNINIYDDGMSLGSVELR